MDDDDGHSGGDRGMQRLCGQFTFMWMDINRIDFWMILIEKNRSDQG